MRFIYDTVNLKTLPIPVRGEPMSNSVPEFEGINTSAPRVVIIGAGVAGMNVISELLKVEKKFNITCITKESVCDYSTCGMPYVLEGVVSSFEDIILHKPEFFIKHNVRLLKNTKVIDINIEEQKLTVTTEPESKELDRTPPQYMDYDYLVLANGRVPVQPPIPGLNNEGVYTLMNYGDGERIAAAMSDCTNALIIGAGIIGLELAVAFVEKDKKPTVVELAKNILPALLDQDMAVVAEEWLQSKGITIITGIRVEEVTGTQTVESVRLSDGSEISTDLVVLSAGIRPNSALAAKAGVDIGKLSGIETDQYQHVLKYGKAIENVFALGDCVESKNAITGKPMLSALASTAVIQARAIAKNIMGRSKSISGFTNPTVTMLAGLQIGCVGLNSAAAEREGMEFKTATAIGKSRARYFPGWKNLHFKFLSTDNRLIGAQIIGEEDVKERINSMALIMHQGIDINKIIDTERCFTPPLALLTDPMLKALNQLI
jgi:NADH oxidase (H2O2-forming)